MTILGLFFSLAGVVQLGELDLHTYRVYTSNSTLKAILPGNHHSVQTLPSSLL